jgi:hypothetical protein
MSDLELTMMRRVGELKAEVERLKKFNDEALAHIAKEERKSRERLDIEQAENARLKAEVEELKSQPDPLTVYLYADTLRRDDIKTLKAHIERLTKAGDAMVEELNGRYFGKRLINDWNAAKEGNGQP